MSKQGYVIVDRGMLEHPRFKPRGPYTDYEAWSWLINAAAFKPVQMAIFVCRQRRVIDLERGQLCYAIRFLAEKWGWGVNRVQRFLRELESDGTIDTQMRDGQTLVTLCNYRTWQDPQDAQEAETDTLSDTLSDTHTETHADTETDRQTDTKKKQLKQLNKDIGRSEKDVGSKLSRPKSPSKEADGFAEWYAIYPKKAARLDAEKAFRQTMARGDITLADLMTRTQAHAANWARRPKDELKYCKHPAAWLRAGGYDDDELKSKASAPAAPLRRPEEFTDAYWRNVIQVWRQERSWTPEHWGPAPGEPGCMVPPEILGPIGGPPNGIQH